MKTPKTTPEPAEVLYFDESGANTAFRDAANVCQRFNELISLYNSLGLTKIVPADLGLLKSIHFGGGAKPLKEKLHSELVFTLTDQHQLIRENTIQQFFTRPEVITVLQMADSLKRGFFNHTSLDWQYFSLEKGLLTVTDANRKTAEAVQFTSYVDSEGKREYLKQAQQVCDSLQAMQALEANLPGAWNLAELFGNFYHLFMCDGNEISFDREHLHSVNL